MQKAEISLQDGSYENKALNILVFIIQYLFWTAIFISVSFVVFEDVDMEVFRYIGF